MKIAVAQIHPLAGDIPHNTEAHQKLIALAAEAGAEMLFFPELSLTGYEPTLAKDLAMTIDDPRLDVFQEASDTHDLSLAVGLPTRSEAGLHITTLVFQPSLARLAYSKQYLHPDEEPYFVSGPSSAGLFGPHLEVALAICYELSIPEHAERAAKNQASIYVASVAKFQRGLAKAAQRLAEIAQTYAMPVLMSNAIGPSDGGFCAGQSAAWNAQGICLAQIDDGLEGIVLYDTTTKEAITRILEKKESAAALHLRCGVDTGGTFTDLILDAGDMGGMFVHKCLSTPNDPSGAVIAGLRTIFQKFKNAYPSAIIASIDVIHGSTVATNALLEGKGAKVAFLTTEGFEDLLWIGRQDRPDLYALHPHKPAPPLQREDVRGVCERMDFAGRVLLPLTDEEIQNTVLWLQERPLLEGIAICFLHSYANPDHERRLASALRSAFPAIPITVSSEILPEFREVERASTCLLNAVVALPMLRYLRRLQTDLALLAKEEIGGAKATLRILSSSGASLPLEVIERYPIQTVLSGPAGGVLGAWAIAKYAGTPKIIPFDMGGTSTDVSLCSNEPQRTTETTIAGLSIRLPMLDIHTVGAGGGSIAWLDPGGALRVGPQSAGAQPGPASYGKQTEPWQVTVTDAHLILGHLSPEQPLGEDLHLQLLEAHHALTPLADAMQMSKEAVALGILRVAEAAMLRAIQTISMQRGHDPRDFALLSFGGAGGLHACSLARELGMTEILLPPNPGLLCAFGNLVASPAYLFSQTLFLSLSPSDPASAHLASHPALQTTLQHLRELADHALASEGIDRKDALFSCKVDLRYQGQAYELTLPLDDGDPLQAFHHAHKALYGYASPRLPVEVVTLRLEASAPSEAAKASLRRLPKAAPSKVSNDAPRRSVFTSEGWEFWPVFQRHALPEGQELVGPLILCEFSSTTLVLPGWSLSVEAGGIARLRRKVLHGRSS